MAEILVMARSEFGDDAGTGLQWKLVRGLFVSDARPDDTPTWSSLEDPRNFATAAQRRFALFRFPGISRARIQKYRASQPDPLNPTGIPIRQLLWQIQWNSLPLVARNILIATGVITIGPTGDFTWGQVQNFFVRLDTGAGDTEPMT